MVKISSKKTPHYKTLLNNYNIAERNDKSLRRRLAKDKSLEEQYNSEMVASDPKRLINYLPQLLVQEQD